MDLDNSTSEELRVEQQQLFKLLVEREVEFGFSLDVLVHYPLGIDEFLRDPSGYIDECIGELEGPRARPFARVVILTTYGPQLQQALGCAGYQEVVIDMPAGPDGTRWYWRDVNPHGSGTLYLEAVDEMDEKIRPTFVLRINDASGVVLAGMSGSIWERDGERFAYVSTVVARSDAPRGIGGVVAERTWRYLREKGVRRAHLGTQTADEFYKHHGFDVVHTIVPKLRYRQHADGRTIWCDLVIMEKILQEQ